MTDLLNTKLSLELLRIVDLKDILSNCTYRKNKKKSELVETIMNFLQNNTESINAQQKAAMCFKIKIYTQLLTSDQSSNCAIKPLATAHPEIHFKSLPFFDTMFILLEPSPMTVNNSAVGSEQTSVFSIHLTPQQVVDLKKNNSDHLVQLRFCLRNASSREQNDNFPSYLKILVNGKICELPNPLPVKSAIQTPKFLPGPVNITHNIKLSTQSSVIECRWKKEAQLNEFFVSCFVMRKIDCNQLVQQLKMKNIFKKEDTAALIKEKMNDVDIEISTTSLRVSLICPLGKMRMITPCRATTCNHLQCFDAAIFIELNEKKQIFKCPICHNNASYEHLVIDEYFQEVLASCNLGADDQEIELQKDGSWNKICNKSEFFNLDSTPEAKSKTKYQIKSAGDQKQIMATIDLTEATPVKTSSLKRTNPMPTKTNATVDLTSSDSDDDNNEAKKSKKN